MERPKELEGRRMEDITPAELERLILERAERARKTAITIGGTADNDTGAGPSHWYENYNAKNSRAWMISDPPDGRMPATTEAARPGAVDAWRAAGAKVEVLPAATGGVDLESVLTLLGTYDVLQALVEGGATLHGSLLAAGLADGLVAYVAPAVLGAGALPMFAGPGPDSLAAAPRFRLESVAALGDDVRLALTPVGPPPGAEGTAR